MSLALINGATVTNFMDDKGAFDTCVNECFEMLDVKGNGALTREEMREQFRKIMASSNDKSSDPHNETIYDAIFERFDEDKNGKIDREEFRALIVEIMFAMARGLGNSPMLVALDLDSLLMKAFKHEMGRE
ncbi:hypothetical protein LINGRAHAP2_LOCUS32074 [Linum grandiflorum]